MAPVKEPQAALFQAPPEQKKRTTTAERNKEALDRAAGFTITDLLELGQRPKAFTSAEVATFVLAKQKHPQQIRVNITPELAALLLKKTKKNRPMKLRYVAGLVRVHVEEGHKLIHAGVALDVKGNLTDGQHRLQMIVDADKAAEMFIAVGMPLSAFSVTNIALAWSLADHLDAADEQNCLQLASALRLLWVYGQEMAGEDPRKPSIDEALLLLAANPDIRDSVVRGAAVSGRATCYATAAPLSVMSHLIYTEHGDIELWQRFMDGVQGIGVEAGSPMATLNNALRKAMRYYEGSGKERLGLSPREVLAWLILAWNATILEKPFRTIRWERADAIPRIVGRPGKQ
ncbi:hypothetical protein [Longispora urticae]